MPSTRIKSSSLARRKAQRAADRERKLLKSFRSLKNVTYFIVFTNFLFDLYLLILVFSSRGEISTVINFLFGAAFTAGLYYSARLLSQENRKALLVLGITVVGLWSLILLSRILSHTALLTGRDILALLLPIVILAGMYQLVKEGMLT